MRFYGVLMSRNRKKARKIREAGELDEREREALDVFVKEISNSYYRQKQDLDNQQLFARGRIEDRVKLILYGLFRSIPENRYPKFKEPVIYEGQTVSYRMKLREENQTRQRKILDVEKRGHLYIGTKLRPSLDYICGEIPEKLREIF